MAHRSRLSKVVIDVPEEALAAAAAFWATALGRRPNRSPEEAQPYLSLVGGDGHPDVVLQRIDGPARYHVDIAADDVDAEVRRLVAAGATVVGPVETWVVLRDPAGLFVCVIPAEEGDFEAASVRWE
ncbi:MAG TPA: VOC family protein [Acidimicrobiales bacterium]|nr:VOC family protein [Acidimicrobiales bacterium]